jgi:hypothetical protein
MKKRIDKHIGEMSNSHNMAQEKFNSFMNHKKTKIDDKLSSISTQDKDKYRLRFTYTLQCLKFFFASRLDLSWT